MMTAQNNGEDMSEEFAQLQGLLSGQKRLLIVLHNNPDPDAIGSASALRYLAEERFNLRTTMAYGGLIGRAENRAMVHELKIPLKRIDGLRLGNYDRIALVDTQPGAGNNSLPSDVTCHIVVDHHPRRRGVRSELTVIEPHMGATATIFVEWLQMSKLAISADLATALAYAIRSETQDLGREATDRDIKAYLSVFPQSSMKKLSRITHPKLPRSYFVALDQMLKRAMSFRHLICAHLEEVPTPDLVAEMADMLLRHHRMSWSLCSGRFRGDLIISLRSSNPNAKAGELIKRLVADRDNAGGHEMFAGGRIQLNDLDVEDVTSVERQLSRDFARIIGYNDATWKPLLDEHED